MCSDSPRMTISTCRLDGSLASDDRHRRRQYVCAIPVPCGKAEAQTADPQRRTIEGQAVHGSSITARLKLSSVRMFSGSP